MSTASVDIGYDLIEGLFTVLDGNVSYDGTTYPVYKSIPKTPASVYVYIGDLMHGEDGTKDDFVYFGTIQVVVCDESAYRADMKKAQGILNVVRGLIKTAKSTVFSVGSRTLIVFSHESMIPVVEQADQGISRVRLIDSYNFIIE